MRLMKQEYLEAKVFCKFKATTNSNHHHPVALNLLVRNFSRLLSRTASIRRHHLHSNRRGIALFGYLQPRSGSYS